MAYDLSHMLVIGISSRALFDLEKEAQIYDEQGLDAYIQYQLAHENNILQPGTAFPLVKGLLALNQRISAEGLSGGDRLVEVIVMSRNSPDTGLRIFNSIHHYGLDITRAAFSGGESLAPYLDAFDVDLFLSKSKSDVQMAIDAGIASALLYDPPVQQNNSATLDITVDETQDATRGQTTAGTEDSARQGIDKLRIAFDADAVLFSEESEAIFFFLMPINLFKKAPLQNF